MAIFLKQCLYKNGRTFLSIVKGFYDPKTKNSKHITIEKIGFLDQLSSTYSDPISFFKDKAKKMNDESSSSETVCEKVDLSKKMSFENNSLNLGYFFLKNIYSELNLQDFFNNKQKSLNVSYNLNKIFSLLVFSRILYPGSKRDTFDNKKNFFEPFDSFSLDDVYRSLNHFCSYKDEIETLLWNNTKDTYKRNTENTYFDCTNYYFEINYNDTDLCNENGEVIEEGYRKRGPEKNHRPDPIVELGLLMDASDIPMAYDLFPGNDSEKQHLLPIVKRVKGKFNIQRTIVVADRGLNTSDNIFYLAGKNQNSNMDGYIYGQSVRGADQEFKTWVLNQDGYINEPIFNDDGSPEMFRKMKFDEEGKCIGYEKKQAYFKHKSRTYPKEITITRDGKRNVKVKTDQKQMVYFSQKYADKQKRDRNQMIERAKDLINNPKKYNKITASGATSYINNIKFDKKTGEVLQGQNLSLKTDKIKEEEKYDGYYSIVTSEINMTDNELRKKYRGLSKIEDTFKVTKTDLETRPVFVWTKEHIEAHFLTCFVALVIVRLLQKKNKEKNSVAKLIESIKSFNVLNTSENYYTLYGANNIIKELFENFNLEIFKEKMTRNEIRKILKY